LRDDQVLIIRGAQAMVNITGARRDIRVERMPTPDGGESAWRERTMLFMDALELDMVEAGGPVLPDLLPGNMEREVRKAYTAFSSSRFGEVRTGLWGCGAFGGDPAVKILLLWLASSLARTRLVVVCDSGGQAFAEKLRVFVEEAIGVLGDTADLRQLLDQTPGHLLRDETLSWFKEQLQQR
jgi:poly(ADP-ribose) glycohydrolase